MLYDPRLVTRGRVPEAEAHEEPVELVLGERVRSLELVWILCRDDHEGLGCPIYEELTFNDQGEITFIEAWSDLDGLRPQETSDRWAEDTGVERLATRIPGLGNATGRIDLDSEAMAAAAAAHPDVADFLTRARDWYPTWLEEYQAAGDDLWERGCGW